MKALALLLLLPNWALAHAVIKPHFSLTADCQYIAREVGQLERQLASRQFKKNHPLLKKRLQKLVAQWHKRQCPR